MTDLTVLAGCRVLNWGENSGEAVARASRHAAERYLERVEGLAGPFTEAQIDTARAMLLELFGGREAPAPQGATTAGRANPYEGASTMHAGRVHAYVSSGTIITVLPVGAAASGCACKACSRARRRSVKGYRRSIQRTTREGMALEFAEKQPTTRKQMLRGDRNAGHSGHGAALRERLATA